MKIRSLVTTFSTTLVVAALAATWAVASPMAASCAAATALDQITASPNESSQFVAAVNQLRESKGLNDLTVDGNLSSIAQNWAVTMGQADDIFHRSNLADGVSINWKRLGENVGMGPTVTDLMNAFIASPHHYENLVDPSFTRIGIGTVRTPGGLMYTAHEFAAVVGDSGGHPAPAPVTAPPVTTPRVTVPHVVAAPRVTTPPTTAPPAPPTTVTTEAPATVQRLVSHHNKLHNGSSNDHQQQQNKSNGRCGAQGPKSVVTA